MLLLNSNKEYIIKQIKNIEKRIIMDEIETKKLNIDDAIKVVETANKISLSDEQKLIVNRKADFPSLVIAAAGSGKTTTEMLDIVVRLLTGKATADGIMALTFSKNSQLDMQAKYRKQIKQANNIQPNTLDLGAIPYIATFDALYRKLYFYLLDVKKLEHPKILDGQNAYAIKKIAAKYIINKSADKSDWDVLDDYLEIKDCLINNGLSQNGLELILNNNELTSDKTEFVAAITALQNSANSPFSHHERAEYWNNYYEVMEVFAKQKAKQQLVDFNDIKINLLKALADEENLKTAKNYMDDYNLVYLDEFQDINKLQWELLTKVLSDKAMNNLVAIGDDDQSIYGWRGSDPRYILNFADFVDQPQTFHLSTNYRTAGNILKIVTGEIAKNKYRLNKTIKPDEAKKNYGMAFSYQNEDNVLSNGNAYLNQLINMIKDKDIKNKDIAVLVRQNDSKTFLADWLHTNGYELNVGNASLILQNTKSYKFAIKMIKMILNDDYKTFSKTNKIFCYGNYFNKHLQEVTAYALKKGYGPVDSISKYADIALEFDTVHPVKFEQSARNHSASYAFKILEELDSKLYTFYKNYDVQKTITEIKNTTNEESLIDRHAWEIRNEFHRKETAYPNAFHDYIVKKDKIVKAQGKKSILTNKALLNIEAAKFIENNPKPVASDELKKADKTQETLAEIGKLCKNATSSYINRLLFNKNYVYANVGYTFDYLINYAFGDAFNLKDFFLKEEHKQETLMKNLKIKDNNSIQVMTLHGSKGLEFNHVFIFGLDSRIIGNDAVNINYWFAPNLSFADFYEEFKTLFLTFDNIKLTNKNCDKKLKHLMLVMNTFYVNYGLNGYMKELKMRLENKYRLSEHDLKLEDHYLTLKMKKQRNLNGKKMSKDEIKEIKDMLETALSIIKWVKSDSFTEQLPDLNENQKKNMINDYVKDKESKLKNLEYVDDERIASFEDEAESNLVFNSDVKNNIYEAIKKISKAVEEERRLLYVGVTRAKDDIFVEYPSMPSPLLFELKQKDMKPLHDDFKKYKVMHQEQKEALRKAQEQAELTNKLIRNLLSND